ncbi:MAG TPA: flavodoxin-dependent (E)-4-hydroxy-3-methylbut-2-enyl-diphosphate synthase, partial [Fimbriimonadaceae bacterium]|nr:flavodoxin-dependent (E)-4-hydroxy-3-methylbut-2-enyl-diphosphate synthase [Fimbriimonadaceae bacterium]
VEYIACPSCGRTKFNLPTVLHRVREATKHLVGLDIAVMGCIVNGPGEMADADYGYVGAAGGKITLYRGKQVVRHGIPQEQGVEALVELLRADGVWQDPPEGTTTRELEPLPMAAR